MEIDPELVERAAGWIAEARCVVVFTGAGVSAESGIPTFRDALTGLWANYDPQALATPQGFLANPKLVWEWYAHRRKLIASKQPNPGHSALAELERLVSELVVVTQNVDGLHRKAGSRKVIELHGNITRVKCWRGDTVIEDWDDEGYEGEVPPRCEQCGNLLRPDVVWFGEQLPQEALAESFRLAERCDLMLVAGTSGQVQPAASLPAAAREAGARVVEVNLEPSEITPAAHLLLKGRSGEVLPLVLERLKSQQNK